MYCQQISNDSSDQITDGTAIIKALVVEREQITREALDEEELQLRLLQTIDKITSELRQKTAEVKILRQQIDFIDQSSLGERKEIEYQEA